MKILCEHCGEQKKYHSAMCGSCMRFGTPLLNIPRSRLAEMGVPADLSAQQLIEFFSQPDDDDTRHGGQR